ncbi:MAG: hypothetical protein IGR92_18115 [Leptolyngbyaceae cyanobacterium T60_A2020_046]|nr:hypothetical protein [Leptolyngbyaceae cyanobacterium T60_A2020_046]
MSFEEFEEAYRWVDIAVRRVRQEGLRDIERTVLEGSWQRRTYQQIAQAAGYTEGYLSRNIGPALWNLLTEALGTPVGKTNFQTAIARWAAAHPDADSPPTTTLPDPSGPALLPAPPAPLPTLSPDVTDFRGRTTDLANLTRWITTDQCRLIGLAGAPQVGKTWLVTKLSQQVKSAFHATLYCDLRDRPPPQALLHRLLKDLNISVKAGTDLNQGLTTLVGALRQYRCLLILDHGDRLLRPGQFAGIYDDPFLGYGHLLEKVAQHQHQSCLMWVGRELPKAFLKLKSSTTKTYRLQGLAIADFKALATCPPTLQATPDDWQRLHDYCGGIPPLVNQVFSRMGSFSNDLRDCLTTLQTSPQAQKTYITDWLATLLSEPEWEVLQWLFIAHRPLTLDQLQRYTRASGVLPALESLVARGVCQVTPQDGRWHLSLPMLLAPSLGDRILAPFQTPAESDWLNWLHRYALLHTDASEGVRQWQRSTLLQPIAAAIQQHYDTTEAIQAFVQQALAHSRRLTGGGYSAGNVLNLAQYWNLSWVELDCAGLDLQEADLQSDCFQGVSLVQTNLAQTMLAKPLGPAPVVAISPNGSQIAIGDQDGRLLLWSMTEERLLRGLELGRLGAVRAIAFSPDGHSLVEGRGDGQVRLWDLRSYRSETLSTLVSVPLTTLAFSADGQLLAGGTKAGDLLVWQLASGNCFQRVVAHSNAVRAIAFSPCSQRVLTCGDDCTAVEWQVCSGLAQHRFRGMTATLRTVAYWQDPRPADTGAAPKPVVVGQMENRLVIWDVASDLPCLMLPATGEPVLAASLSPDGQILTASDINRTVQVWDLCNVRDSNDRQALCTLAPGIAPVESLVFHPTQPQLVTSADYAVQLWELPTGDCLRQWRSDRHPAEVLALTTDPRQVLSSHPNRTLRCWQRSPQVPRWVPQQRLTVPHPQPVVTMATGVLNRRWAIADNSGTVYLWHVQNRSWLSNSLHQSACITAMAFSTDETWLAIGDETGTLALWHLETNTCRWQQPAHERDILALVFSPTGDRLYSGSADHTLLGWHLNGDRTTEYIGHRRRVTHLCLSPNGDRLYSSSHDGTVRQWNTTTAACEQTWQGGDRRIHGTLISQGGEPLILMGDLHALVLWDPVAAEVRHTLAGHSDTLWEVVISPDHRIVLSASQDGEVRLWQVSDGTLMAQFRIDRPYEGLQIGGCRGLPDPERQMLYSLGAVDH